MPFLPLLSLSNFDWGGRGFVYAIEHAHLPGLIVAGILLLLSVVSWSVMFTKFNLVSKASQKNYKFVYGFRKAKGVMEPYEANFSVPGAPLYAVYRAGSRELAIHLIGAVNGDDARRSRLPDAETITPDQMDGVRNAMDRAAGETVVALESKMSFLATAVSGAPFLGLLGTVWGVMETFSGVAEAGTSASIQSMAPGVAAALVTTVIALLVAIPAMFGYNFLITRIRTLILEMHNFAAELNSLFEREYVDYAAPRVVIETAPASPFTPHPDAGASTQAAAPAAESFLPTSTPASLPTSRPAPAPGVARTAAAATTADSGGPPINPIAQQAASRRRVTKPPSQSG